MALVFVKGTLVLGAAALATHLLRRRSAAYRHQVWIAGLIAAVLMALLGSSLPAWGDAPFTYPRETALVGIESIETAPMGTESSEPAEVGTVARESAAPVPGGEPADAAVPPALPPASIFLLVWWIGALGVCVRLFGDLVHVAYLRITSRRTAPDHPAARLLEAERRRLGVTRSVTLLVCGAEGFAATLGVFRPVVVVGEDVASLPTDRLRAVLLHELAHVIRWDFATNLLGALAMPVFWANPMFWWARKRTELEREQACDDMVLDSGVKSAEYARLLLDFATTRPALSPAMRSTLGFFPLSPARARIDAILQKGLDRRPTGTASGAVVMMGALAVLVPVGSLSLVASIPGTGSSAELVAALEHADPSVRTRAASTLGKREALSARTALESLLSDPDSDVRIAAASALVSLADPASIPAMAKVLERPFEDGKGEHGYVLKLAMVHLGATDASEAADVLERQLERPVPQLRWLALETLVAMPSHRDRAVPHLIRFSTSDPDPTTRRLAVEALKSADPAG